MVCFDLHNPGPAAETEDENDERTPGEADVREGQSPSDRSNPGAPLWPGGGTDP
jgi:hypothetical protein